ncbi:MAG: MmgE/PrpD family protein [Pseudomonadota bacterium]
MKTRPPSESAVSRVAEFIATHPRGSVDVGHLARAADAVLDTFGCMLLGRDAPVTLSALEASRNWGRGDVPVLGTEAFLPSPSAALVGGAAAHAFDLDDYTLIANDHPSAVLVPALLSEAARGATDLNGRDLLDAYLIGLEVIFRAGEAVNMGHYNRGWHTTSTLDSLGATAAIARLNRLTAKETASALSLTTSLGGGFVSQFGTMAKPLHAGISAKAGIIACGLAQSGASASRHVLDGPVSLATLMAPSNVPGFETALEGIGETWGLDRFGLGAKLYPSCGYTHRTIDGAIELRQRLEGPDIDTIAEVELSLPDFHLAILPYGVPQTSDEALFSAPWCASVALATGACTSADFTPEGLLRHDIRALTARTEARARTPRNPAINLDPNDPDRVTVVMRDGRRETAEIDLWTGAPGRDLGRDGLIAKFRDNCSVAGIKEQQADRLESATLELAEGGPLAGLYRSMAEIDPPVR